MIGRDRMGHEGTRLQETPLEKTELEETELEGIGLERLERKGCDGNWKLQDWM
jgi:hypothetical protein